MICKNGGCIVLDTYRKRKALYGTCSKRLICEIRDTLVALRLGGGFNKPPLRRPDSLSETGMNKDLRIVGNVQAHWITLLMALSTNYRNQS
jgi:hypothetical protein